MKSPRIMECVKNITDMSAFPEHVLTRINALVSLKDFVSGIQNNDVEVF